jgi:hypothetical protein
MTAMTATGSQLRVDDLRGYAQGEIFLLKKDGDHLTAAVYNSTGFGSIPADKFEAIDVQRLAAENGYDLGWKNPRRFWTLDAATVSLAGEPRELQGLKFHLMAQMQLPANFQPPQDQSALAYHPLQIARVNTWEFRSGRPVFLLRSPDQTTWVMQTYTDHVDHDLTEAGLPGLGDRLNLASGWQYKTVTLSQDLTIATTGLAHIVPDNLANMYQGCIDGVNNFDPWD